MPSFLFSFIIPIPSFVGDKTHCAKAIILESGPSRKLTHLSLNLTLIHCYSHQNGCPSPSFITGKDPETIIVKITFSILLLASSPGSGSYWQTPATKMTGKGVAGDFSSVLVELLAYLNIMPSSSSSPLRD